MEIDIWPIKKWLTNLGTPDSEGKMTKAIERQTSKVPSGFFLALAAVSIAASLGLQMAGRHRESNFVGLWVPTILLLGLYNKLVKLEGSEGKNKK